MITLTIINILVSFLLIAGCAEFARGGVAERALDGLEYHKVRHKSDRPFQLRQEGNHPKIIESEAVMRQKLEYLHDNPVKRGYVSDPTH